MEWVDPNTVEKDTYNEINRREIRWSFVFDAVVIAILLSCYFVGCSNESHAKYPPGHIASLDKDVFELECRVHVLEKRMKSVKESISQIEQRQDDIERQLSELRELIEQRLPEESK